MRIRAVSMLSMLCAALTVQAAEQRLVLRDWTGRGFAPDAVTYAVTGARADRLRLFDAAGQPVPLLAVATGRGTASVTFVTDLPPGETREFILRDDARGKVPGSAVSVRKDGDSLVLANGLLAVRVPAAQEKTFRTPVAASTLPPPLLAFRGADGAPATGLGAGWRGSATMLTARPVTGFRLTRTAEGPVFCEVRYELAFATGGFYRATVRVEDRVPLVKISEEYDPGVMDGSDGWELNLAAGWAPDRMEIASTAGNGQVDAGRVEPLENLAKKPSWYLIPDSAWGPLSQLGLFAESARQASPEAYPMAGIVPLHKGDWRRMNGIEIHSAGPQEVRARFPMSVRHASWLREVTSETSPFSMQEHEPGLPSTYGRRHWGLVLAQSALTCKVEGGRACGPFYGARLLYGVVGLDRYKDYVLEWPDSGVTYPRLYLPADGGEAYRQHLQGGALPAEFVQKLTAGTIALGADAAAAARKAEDVRKRLAGISLNVLSSPTTGHHWTAPQYMTAAAADDVLGWPDLPPAARAEIRTRIALICHLWEDPDIISFGNGAHTGNPNMGTARFSPMVAFLPLVPDHPQFVAWRTHMAAYVAHKAAIQTAPGGGYFEYGSAYHMHGYSRVMNVIPALQAAGAPGLEHLLDLDRANWAYYLNLLTPPDSRWKHRVIPGMANSAPGYTEHLLEAAGALAGREPELAANLAWGWLANGANDRGSPLWEMNGQLAGRAPAPREPALGSAIFPGVGVIFRAHQGPDETYLFLRSGFNWSHWNEDQGHMVLLSRGATLLPFQPYQYWNVKSAEFDDHNTIRFGHPENRFPHGWPDSNILDHAFGGRVDYAWSSTGFPDWYIEPGATPAWRGDLQSAAGNGIVRKLADGFDQTQGAFTWDRQVLFLKGRAGASPNYFVVRDSTRGEGRLASWFCLNLLGTQADVQALPGRLAVDTEWPVKLDVRFPLLPQPPAPEFHEENQYVALGGWSGPSWWRTPGTLSKNWVTRDGQPLPPDAQKDFFERHTLLRLAAAPGAGHLWVIYPRTAAEPEPQVSAPEVGVLKIEHPEGTDYAFLSPTPFAYEAEGVLFHGCAGAVRIGRDGAVTLALTGGRGRVGYKDTILAGTAPFERSFTAAEFNPGEQAVPAPVAEFATDLPVAADLAAAAPGVALAEAGGRVVCQVDPAAAGGHVTGVFGKGIRLEAQGKAFIVADGPTVRFVVPEAAYVKLSVGTVGVRGFGPFDLTFTPERITGTVAGRTRSLVVTWPEQIVRPMFHLDGRRWYAGWADDHAISKGAATPQLALAFGVTAGTHTVDVAEWAHPVLPAAPTRAAIDF